jgi:hypothetical protein
LLDDHGHSRLSHERRSDDSADSDSWTDTGDLAEQLADEEDPLRKTLADTSLNDDLIAGVLKRHPKHNKRVQFRHSVDEHSVSRSISNLGLIDKEAIQIPNVPPRHISRGERIIAAIMPGTGLHGFTGKALMYVLDRLETSLAYVKLTSSKLFYEHLRVVRCVSFRI